MPKCSTGQCHEIFNFRFFHGLVSPKPLIKAVSNFFEFSSRCTTGVVDTMANGKNLQSGKFSLFLLDTFGNRVSIYEMC